MTERGHIGALTGVRGLASLWVLAHHMPNLYPLGEWAVPAAVHRVLEKGWLGVDLFFVLSGFVISYVYARSMASPSWSASVRFWKLRLARVYPAHVVATLAFAPVYFGARFAFGYVSPNDAFSLQKLAYALTLTNGWGFPDSSGWNLPSWSVSSEWAAYLAFPALTLAAGRLRGVWPNLMAAGGVLALMVAIAARVNGGEQFILPDAYTLTRIGSEFTIGCLLFNAYDALRDRRCNWADGAAAVALVAVAGLSASGVSPVYDWALVAGFAVLVLSLALATGPLGRAFSSRTAVWLGEISYSVYLIHTVLLLVAGQALQRVFPDPSAVSTLACSSIALGFVAASVGAGHLLFTLVEEPARRWLRRVWVS